MTDPQNHTIKFIMALRNDIATHREETRVGFEDVKHRLGGLEGGQAFLMGVMGMSKTGANQWATLDRHERRIERIERQLNLVSE
jgi:hypothetical protein